MTARTHDLAAFTALTATFVLIPTPQMSLATLLTAIFANMIGGLIPDLDNHASEFWDKLRGGQFLAAVIAPLFGGHRMFSHSLLGFVFFSFLSRTFLTSIDHILLVDTYIVWLSFLIGFASHLIMDAITKDGIPLFFPLRLSFALPPLRLLRIRTGSIGEHLVVKPLLICANLYLFYHHHQKFLDFLRHQIN